MEEFKLLIIVIVTMLALLVVLAVAPAYLLDRATCSAKAEAQGYEHEYGIFKGCMVKTENGWLDYSRLIYKKDVE